MSKRKRKDDLPPEGLWISPEGRWIPVVEHLLALQHHPDEFGLSEDFVKRMSIVNLRNLAVDMITNGWIRFRYLSGVYAFEVDNAKRRIEVIEDVLQAANALPNEAVAISQISPMREFQAAVQDAFDRTIFGFQENPNKNTWRLS